MGLKSVAVLFALVLAGCRAPAQPSQVSPSPSLAQSPIPSPSPSPSPTLRFAVKGDWGAGTPAQREVTSAMCAARVDNPFDLILTTGDNFYPRGTARKDSFDEPEACLLSYPSHSWKASWGNHDVPGTSTRDLLGTPSRYYSFDELNVTFLILDSNRPSDSEQIAWLEKTLQEARGDVRVVVFHHPPFTTGSVHENNPFVQRNWVPLFERHGVDLVLNGHNHLYEHSEINGLNYVVTGGGGASLYGCARSETWLRTCRAVHHFVVVEIVGRQIRVTAIDRQGSIFDDFTFTAP